MTFAIDQDIGDESGANLALGHDDEFQAFALNSRLCSGDQLVGAFGRHQDEAKLAVDALWKLHVFNLFRFFPPRERENS